jgi:hypothetical protein
MLSPGIKSLGDFTITAAGTQIGEAVEGLDGMAEADVQVRFAYGSGGSICKVFIQSSLDQGTTWFDLWCFAAATAQKIRARRLKPDGNELTPGDGALADDTVASGLALGDRLRAKIVSTGVYAGSTVVSVRANAR